MFAKNSRYFSLENIRTVDSRGRILSSKSLRRIPKRETAFLHRVQKADRLDLLAHKFYRDPDKWWLIADANPAWQLPSEILDRYPMAKYMIEISPAADDQHWLDLHKKLNELTGVAETFIDRDAQTIHLDLNVKITKPEEIIDLIESMGFTLLQMPRQIPRTGAEIAIPPNQST